MKTMLYFTMFGGPLDGTIKESEEPDEGDILRFGSSEYTGTYHVFDDFAIYVEREPDEEITN